RDRRRVPARDDRQAGDADLGRDRQGPAATRRRNRPPARSDRTPGNGVTRLTTESDLEFQVLPQYRSSQVISVGGGVRSRRRMAPARVSKTIRSVAFAKLSPDTKSCGENRTRVCAGLQPVRAT